MELSPDTATGVYRKSVVLAPSCAAHKASQPHHNPAHPTSRSPLRPSPKQALAPARCSCPPNTTSLQATPQSHTRDAANTRVSSRHSNPSRMHLPHSIPHHITSHHAHAAASLHPITHRTHTPKHSSTSQPIQLAQMHANAASARHKHAPHLKRPQLPTAHNARYYPSS